MASRLMTGSTSRRWRELAPRMGLPVPAVDDYIEILEGADLDAWFQMANAAHTLYLRTYRPDVIVWVDTPEGKAMEKEVADVVARGDGLLLVELMALVEELRQDITERQDIGQKTGHPVPRRAVWA